MQDFLQGDEQYPADTAVLAARWQSAPWGPSAITACVEVDARAAAYIDDSGTTRRDHTESCFALWPSG